MISNVNTQTVPGSTSSGVDKASMTKGIALGAAGALAVAAVIGGASYFAFTRDEPIEQVNRVGTPTTVIGDASPGQAATQGMAPSAQALVEAPKPAPVYVPTPVPVPAPAPVQPRAAQLPPAAPVAQATPAERPANRVAQGQTGTITAIHEVNVKGEANGVGAAMGGVLGGLLGHQVGGGNGRTAMTVVGAVGGGLAGHEVQKRMNGTKVYNVTVQFDDGSSKTLRESSTQGFRNGDRVRVRNGVISSENA